MIIQTVKFKSALSEEEVRRVMEERIPQFHALRGLLQKYYVREPATGEISGIYLWDAEESLRAFRASELAQTIPSAYRVIGQPRIETFEVLFPLRQEESTVTRPTATVTS
jgi:heme-degrading monooxygenase HmoA